MTYVDVEIETMRCEWVGMMGMSDLECGVGDVAVWNCGHES